MTKLKDLRNEIRGLDIAALVAKSKALKIEINDLVLDKNMNKLKDLKSISKKRKDMARILTVLAQKQMIVKLEPAVEKTEDKKSEEKEGKKK